MLRISAGQARDDTEWSLPKSDLQFAGTMNISVAGNSELTSVPNPGDVESGSTSMVDQFSRGQSSYSSRVAKVSAVNESDEKFAKV
jgi:hypothetical protein